MWTATRTWNTGDVVTASHMNAYWRDNLDYLKDLADRGYIPNGLDADKPASPQVGDSYLATDTRKLYVCYNNGVWTSVSGVGTYGRVTNNAYFSTTSTLYVDYISISNVNLYGPIVLVGATIPELSASTSGSKFNFQLAIDSVSHVFYYGDPANHWMTTITGIALFTSITPGTYTISVQVKREIGTATLKINQSEKAEGILWFYEILA